MANILFLAHRIPYPPNKGDKIRSWNFLSHFLKDHKVHLGFFIDDKKDRAHVEFLMDRTESLCFEGVNPRLQKLRSLTGLLTNQPLTISAYPYSKLRAYCKELLDAGQIDLIFLFSAATAPVLPAKLDVPVVLDLVDVDSEKWRSYGAESTWPFSWLYEREGRKLGEYESRLAEEVAQYTALVSDQEAELFSSLNPKSTSTVKAIPNGVDLDQFTASDLSESFSEDIILFTGAMDYQPNIEAVAWFAHAIWPNIKRKHPSAVFRIAGGPAAPQVLALAKQSDIEVLGYVDDMALEIAKAAVCIAPLKTARGIQNKVLEAMATSKAIVVTSLANEGINAVGGESLEVADTEKQFADAVLKLLDDPGMRKSMGSRARKFVEREFTWGQAFEKLDSLIGECL